MVYRAACCGSLRLLDERTGIIARLAQRYLAIKTRGHLHLRVVTGKSSTPGLGFDAWAWWDHRAGL